MFASPLIGEALHLMPLDEVTKLLKKLVKQDVGLREVLKGHWLSVLRSQEGGHSHPAKQMVSELEFR